MICFYESDNSYKYCKLLQRPTAKAKFAQSSFIVKFIQHTYYKRIEHFLFYLLEKNYEFR